ncbi:rhodanese-like domain-containing protein [Paenibacillus sp. N1-5-1-14]|uniref:rhodanese-like domain-containing protein n=1 Tax=Paenibacillus radicibacter TaxID=2972488 RepID=UPI0021596620|nr:rhodanese-like domain-containing protein [Paenibacillus radicibacter]MCR8641851.1 rhodanese-like domain-containing protein [Paenibacillus radicibacter]
MDPIIYPSEVKSRLENGEKLTIIDVREDEEVAQGMIPTAVHIRLHDLPHRHNEIPESEEIILVCRSGGRSGTAQDYLDSLGYTGLRNMVGGMLEWVTLD